MSRNDQDRWDAGELDYKAERDQPRPDFEFVEHGSICLLTSNGGRGPRLGQRRISPNTPCDRGR